MLVQVVVVLDIFILVVQKLLSLLVAMANHPVE
jgi:hypothetical protein